MVDLDELAPLAFLAVPPFDGSVFRFLRMGRLISPDWYDDVDDGDGELLLLDASGGTHWWHLFM